MGNNNYAYLMVEYDTPPLIKEIQKQLNTEDLFVKDGKYGIEQCTHTTIVPCLDNNISIEELKPYIYPLNKYGAVLTDISKFDFDDHDVLKCSCASDTIYNTNKKITSVYPSHSEFSSEYKPHVTIAYVKKGICEKFMKDILSPLIILKPKCFCFSHYDGNGNEIEERFT